MAITISAARIEQVTHVITKWCESFVPFDETHTVDDFLSVFDENVEWYDHGFYVVRKGHEAVLGLHKGFLYCNEPFRAEVKVSFPHHDQDERWNGMDLVRSYADLHVLSSGVQSISPTVDGAAVEQIWRGVCKNDIVRPDGTVVVKATGREFEQRVGFLVKVSEEGKIVRIDEYDHRYWEEGRGVEGYARL